MHGGLHSFLPIIKIIGAAKSVENTFFAIMLMVNISYIIEVLSNIRLIKGLMSVY